MEHSDEELVAQCRAGGIDAFELLFRRYERRVFNLIARTVGNPDDVEDLKQEVFYRAYKSLSSFRGGCRFSTWLYRIAVNLCMDYGKRKKAVTCVINEFSEETSWEAFGHSIAEDPQEAVEQKELQRAVRLAVLSLPTHYRILIVLRYLNGLSYDEIAGAVGCSVNALNVRLHRARAALREKMMPYLTAVSEGKIHEVQTGKTEDVSAV